MNNYTKLIISILIAQSAGLLGSLFTASSVDTWYASLVKPALNPPSWVFAPVWLTLYTLIGIAFYLIWKHGVNKKYSRLVLLFFLGHLALNALWSVLFFGAQNISLAFVDILLIVATLIILMVLAWRIDRRATYLLAPYLAWVSFATYLNGALLVLNT